MPPKHRANYAPVIASWNGGRTTFGRVLERERSPMLARPGLRSILQFRKGPGAPLVGRVRVRPLDHTLGRRLVCFVQFWRPPR